MSRGLLLGILNFRPKPFLPLKTRAPAKGGRTVPFRSRNQSIFTSAKNETFACGRNT